MRAISEIEFDSAQAVNPWSTADLEATARFLDGAGRLLMSRWSGRSV
jgi:hypothetical protein